MTIGSTRVHSSKWHFPLQLTPSRNLSCGFWWLLLSFIPSLPQQASCPPPAHLVSPLTHRNRAEGMEMALTSAKLFSVSSLSLSFPVCERDDLSHRGAYSTICTECSLCRAVGRTPGRTGRVFSAVSVGRGEETLHLFSK